MIKGIDPSKIRVGDTVEARFVVQTAYPHGVYGAYLSNIRRSVYVPIQLITEIIPAPKEIKVGDRVKWEGQQIEVVALDQDSAWLRIPGGHISAPLSTLTLIEDEGHG